MSDLLQSTAGESVTFEFGPVTRGPGGTPVDLTVPGTKLWFTARTGYGRQPTVQLDYGVTTPDTGNGIAVNDPATTEKNKLTVTIPAAATEQIAQTTDLVYDLWLREPGGRQEPIFRGEWQVRAAVTAPA